MLIRARDNGGGTRHMMRRYYFPVASALMLSLTLLGFSDNLFTNVDQPSNHDPKFIIHGMFSLAWMMVLTVQVNLVSRGNVRLHRKLGMMSIFVAVGVTLSTAYVFVAVWKGWDSMPVVGKANRLLLPSYALLVLLGFLNRKRPDRHKRLLFVATLFMMEPVLSRAFDPFDAVMVHFSEPQIDRAWWIFFVIVWNGFFLSLFAYDRLVDQRIHAVTAGGYAWFCVIWTTIWFV